MEHIRQNWRIKNPDWKIKTPECIARLKQKKHIATCCIDTIRGHEIHTRFLKTQRGCKCDPICSLLAAHLKKSTIYVLHGMPSGFTCGSHLAGRKNLGNGRGGSEMGEMTKRVLRFESLASTDKLSTHKFIQIHVDEKRLEWFADTCSSCFPACPWDGHVVLKDVSDWFKLFESRAAFNGNAPASHLRCCRGLFRWGHIQHWCGRDAATGSHAEGVLLWPFWASCSKYELIVWLKMLMMLMAGGIHGLRWSKVIPDLKFLKILWFAEAWSSVTSEHFVPCVEAIFNTRLTRRWTDQEVHFTKVSIMMVMGSLNVDVGPMVRVQLQHESFWSPKCGKVSKSYPFDFLNQDFLTIHIRSDQWIGWFLHSGQLSQLVLVLHRFDQSQGVVSIKLWCSFPWRLYGMTMCHQTHVSCHFSRVFSCRPLLARCAKSEAGLRIQRHG